MKAKVERIDGHYKIELTDYANKFHLSREVTEEEARDLASDMEGCARAIFAMLPEVE